MPRMARAEVFAPDEIAIVHVMNRVVRRCFLLGTGSVTGKNYDHRKVWIERYLQQFAASFGIDVTYIWICIGLVAGITAVCLSVVYYGAIWRFRHPAFPSGELIEWRDVVIHLRKGEGTLVVIEGVSPGAQYLWYSQRLPQDVTVMESYADDDLPCTVT